MSNCERCYIVKRSFKITLELTVEMLELFWGCSFEVCGCNQGYKTPMFIGICWDMLGYVGIWGPYTYGEIYPLSLHGIVNRRSWY